MRRRKYSKIKLEEVVAQSYSISEVLRRLGLKNTGGSHRLIRMRIDEYEINCEHFTGSGWAKSQTVATHPSVLKTSIANSISNNECFVERSGCGSSKLLFKLLGLGYENKCDICHITEWMGKPIRLHVDHINGISRDNRLNNLRILCPNCHQQTETWGSKNRSALIKLPSDPPACQCGERKSRGATICRTCENNRRRTDIYKKFNPSPEYLRWALSENISFTTIGKKNGVSATTVRNRMRQLGLLTPPTPNPP